MILILYRVIEHFRYQIKNDCIKFYQILLNWITFLYQNRISKLLNNFPLNCCQIIIKIFVVFMYITCNKSFYTYYLNIIIWKIIISEYIIFNSLFYIY